MDFLSQNQGGGEAKPELVWLTGSGMNKSEQVDESMLFFKKNILFTAMVGQEV